MPGKAGTRAFEVQFAEVELCRIGNRANVVRKREDVIAAEINLAAVGLELADCEREFA